MTAQRWDWRGTWQGRVLCAADKMRSRMSFVVPSILAHTEAEITMLNLMVDCEPLCWDPSRMSLRTPFICSIAKIDKRGRIVADVIWREVPVGAMRKRDYVFFTDLIDFETDLRRCADAARLDDNDRVQFFNAAKQWVGADRRLDPHMDPRDPDARRLTVQ